MGGCWYLDFPIDQYNENVEQIALDRGLTIIDAKFQGANLQMRDVPILTKKEKQTTKK